MPQMTSNKVKTEMAEQTYLMYMFFMAKTLSSNARRVPFETLDRPLYHLAHMIVDGEKKISRGGEGNLIFLDDHTLLQLRHTPTQIS